MHGKNIGQRWAGLVAALLVLGIFSTFSAARPTSAQTVDQLKVGPVSAIAIDDVGGGWGWTGPRDEKDSGHLLRLENGAWHEDLRDNPASAVLKSAEAIYNIAISSDGKSGWALGTGGGMKLWKLANGTWQTATNPFSGDTVWNDLTLSADGSDGWIVVTDNALHYKLARLQNGTWKAADQPVGVEVHFLSISPDGKSGWAVGVGSDPGANVALRFDSSGWLKNPAGSFDLAYNTGVVTADNQGNGWAVGPPINSVLMRLTPKGTKASEINPATTDKYPGVVLQAVKVNGAGHGWATGVYNKSTIQLGGPVNETIQVLFWLNGDTITEVPFSEVPSAASGAEANYAGPLAISPDGAHAWLAASDGDSNFMKLVQLKEAWTHDTPAQAAPLEGAGVCFAESQYCLRGIFARYWHEHGGLDSMGYPVTPEVMETHNTSNGAVQIVVQYTQRARLEWHPEFKGTQYEVLLGLLGNSLADPRSNEAPFMPKPASAAPDAQWFDRTQHNLSPPLLAYWTSNGGLDVFGYPRSEQFMEQNHADGKLYTVQYFERNRIEYHPENAGTKYEFQLGLLGTEEFLTLYGYTP